MGGFKKFLLRGNVIELAVAVVIGAAFTAIVNSFVKDVLTPALSAIAGAPNFGNLKWQIGDAVIGYGNFLNALVSFLIVATVVYFFIVRPYELLMARFAPAEPKETRECPQCLTEVPKAATRCSACTSELTPVSEQGSGSRTGQV
ncbi:large-conductance mechanosensitive channel [Acrocarpospora phusangensis]|uniref:Large-conductance mechanosensitive channel n=1 Tax=Acrocarpospora phusangensis TaxID=1070424 RepID=A0A919QLS9_9ACTN|nr:large conductance mechanosensitive channel protein MscL [Acrocarpospora phusangensis]GIH28512.1 large-conductance mechanosensitive channel [Acrocarpospora phusangensis]